MGQPNATASLYTDMSVVVIVEFSVKAESFDQFLDWADTVLKGARRSKGCHSVDVHVEKASSNVVFIERWESFADHENYVFWRDSTGFQSTFTAFTDGPMKMRSFMPKHDV